MVQKCPVHECFGKKYFNEYENFLNDNFIESLKLDFGA